MWKWLSRWRPYPPLAPQTPFYAIGDIHGRMDLLQILLDDLDPDLPVVCLGDYIDRGPDSAAVLRFLQSQPRITCLMGNHEAMLLRFLDAPTMSASWLRHGGLETLESFGIAFDNDLASAQRQLRAALGKTLIGWLRTRPLWWQSGNVILSHAGADPFVDMNQQWPRHLLWGHPKCFRRRRPDGLWLVHGHVIVAEPDQRPGRINVDTGAFATDRLTAAYLDQDRVQFVEASPRLAQG